MLGLGPRANFHFHWIDLVRDTRRPDDLATLPEVERLSGGETRLLCVYGVAERESACRDAPVGLMRAVARPDGHHFGGDYRALGDLVADAILR
jgi:type IV secretory pathway VirJ component